MGRLYAATNAEPATAKQETNYIIKQAAGGFGDEL
jgi:hypothetical protein